jgi:hypothetical protein
MNIRYRVELNEGQRAQLTAMVSGGKHAVRKLKPESYHPNGPDSNMCGQNASRLFER